MSTGIGFRGTLREAARMTAAEPSRVALSIVGIALGLATLTTTVGLAQSADAEIQAALNGLSATQVEISVSTDTTPTSRDADPPTWDELPAIGGLSGVVSWGAVAELDGQFQISAGAHVSAATSPVFGSSAGLADTIHLSTQSGRFFDQGHVARSDRVAIVGAALARRLSIGTTHGRQTLQLGDETYVLGGILDNASGAAKFSNAVLVPHTAAPASSSPLPTTIYIQTEPGHAASIARAAVATLRPASPQSLRATVPPTPVEIQAAIADDTRSLLYALGGIGLVIGGLSIANVSLVSVLERVGEIGLRRALGASRVAVSGQFVAESALAGFAGGLTGGLAGLVVVSLAANGRGWTPIIDPTIPLAAPVVGLAIGAISGLYPAYRASTIEPSTAVRQGQ